MFEIFKEPFMETALLGGLIVGLICAYLGVFVILKRIVFMGIVLSEVAALGVAIGLFVGISPMFSAFILTILAVLLFWIPFTEKNISREALLGFTYAFCAAMAIILIAKNPIAEARGLNLISGNLLYTTWSDIKLLGIAAAIILFTNMIFFKEFIFISFDRETAFTTGLKTNLLDFLLYLTIGTAISLSMKICGVIFVFASLIIPAMGGLLIAKTIGKIFISSILIALFSVLIGLWLSYKLDLPSGPAIVGLYGLFFIGLTGAKSILGKR
ncbi:MAG: metal ABC transporter permease [Candidatus Omnitrophica bacterium]|nr:metal ABC transporter permease [Candidatus Omnitrophota bacterium]MBU4488513.1 metal ABC transporter permease [Candidatus Omnitrophota bacterium]MCG2704575.1 metal ABC transporter permease [Candidatus Omnitrophota bacterium]